MFNITNPKTPPLLVCLPPAKFFNYNEGFGRQTYHERGRFGDKMEKMDGTLISTFLHQAPSCGQVLRLKSKRSLTSKQVLESMKLLTGDLKSEMERLVRLNYTVNMEYTSPSNHVFVSYTQDQLTVLSVRSHIDGHLLFGSTLKAFLIENNLPTILSHIVPFESVSPNMTHQQLLHDIYQQSHGEGYVVQIIHPDNTSYLVKIKTKKYLDIHRDGSNPNSQRSLFEALINEHLDDLMGLFQNDSETLNRIDDMENKIRPKYNEMIASIERFYHRNKHLSKKAFAQTVSNNNDMKIYLPLLMNLYQGQENDYKTFAIKHAKDLFDICNDEHQSTSKNEAGLECEH